MKKGGPNLDKLRGLADLNAMAQGAQEDRVLLLDPDDIVVEKQVRSSFKGIEELAESMRVLQQLPIVVSPLNKDTGKYLLQKGERRLRAAQLIGSGFKIKAIVDSTKRSRAQHTASQLIENIQREDLTPIEIGRSLVDIREGIKADGGKGTGKELATILNKPESWISRHLALADVPEEVAQLIEEGITVDSEIIYSLKQIHELDSTRFADLIERARLSQLSREEVRNELKEAKGPTKPARDKEKGEGGHKASDQPADTPRLPDAPVEAPSSLDDADVVPQTPGAVPEQEPDAKSSSKPKPKAKLGKAEVAIVPPERMVVFVRVALDKELITGELLLSKVCGDPSKGVVVLMQNGRQIEKLVSLDQVEIITMQQMDTEE